MKKILFYGTSTYKNKGVEAIVQSTLNQINTEENKITIATYDIEHNSKYYNDKVSKYIKHYKDKKELTKEDINTLKEYDKEPYDYKKYESLYQTNVIDEIKDSDICISIGGDNYCYNYSEWLYALDETVKENNKKLVLWGASLYEELDDVSLINDMNLFDILVIRESLSYNAIRKFVNEDKIIYVPDPAFSLTKEKVDLNPFYKNNKVVALNVSPYTITSPSMDDERFKATIKLIDYILNETNYGISLIPHVTIETCNDMDILNKLYELYKDNDRVFLESEKHNCNQIKYIISKCELVIAARTHASIAAYSTNVPTLVIGYSVKSRGIAKDLFGTHENYVIPCDELKEDNLVNAFKWLVKNKNKIKTTLKSKTPDYINRAGTIFEQVLTRLEENSKKYICSSNSCIGCNVCATVCPKNAIKMEKDSLGFIYPKIDKNKCIDCNICKNKCPINQKILENKFEPICYAAKNKDNDERMKSTSGGVFPLLAKYILKEKGIVYGATIENYKTSHIRIDKEKDLYKILGSKYSQSSLINVLPKIKKDIKDNKLILFSGTPCQVGAIKALVGDYKNIYYVSVICHGVINDDILERYMKEENIKDFTYRTKDNGWSTSSVKIVKDQTPKVIKFMDCSLTTLYIHNSILRNSCYECKFKGKNNQADIILGDYWGINSVHPEMFDEKGVSALIINSQKGKNLITKSKAMKKLITTETTLENILIQNPSLNNSSKKPLRRYTIEEDLQNNTMKIISELDKYKNELNLLKPKAIEFEKIINSKRWIYTNKMADSIFFRISKKILRVPIKIIRMIKK